MSILQAVAEAVAFDLNPYGAVFTVLPEFETKDTAMRVLVAPRGIKYKNDLRGSNEKEVSVDVGILKKVSVSESLESLLDIVQEIAEFLQKKRLSTYNSAVCIEVANDPVYSPEYLRERGTFVSIITFTFKVS